MRHNQGMHIRRTPMVLLLAVLAMAGCAGKAPQGYGTPSPQQETAAQAQQQLQSAQRATQVDNAQTYLDLITQMQQAGQWYASLAHTEAFEQQYGASPESLLMRADALRNTGQAEQARQAYQSLLQGATQARARRGLGLLHASQGQYGQAVEQLDKARQLNPIDASVLSDLAYAHMLDGRLDAAQIPIMQASQLAPGNARVQLNLALFWLASGNQAQASRLLRQLAQPQAKGVAPLIDQTSLQTLQTQLAGVREAVRLRSASLSPEPGTSPPPAPLPENLPAQVVEPGSRNDPDKKTAPSGTTRRILLSEPPGTPDTAPASPL
ncbi:Flp pilus assembly protein TadD, contains TPR repeats [Delftia tsuruhatensis]|uniref:tetratricopeptide repeat protein n=1 Tax=Delftia tsuruhatensis TaxID=180282 RepID=UPI001E7DBB07|nr:tetratricopeptide repeat protein [Delftia tsuruhatensis]CAB5685147.1 Flp pilus assembly protein TadD, contains TPR repeats [Delftia tsuruhatensis]CAC9690088.1 Flp pilus assembly protein TadD, contains TPR repeats [Delftia tsuruhatensis]